MQPNEQYTPPSPHGDYDFIMNPAPPPKRSLIPGGGSVLTRVALAAIGLIVLIVAFNLIHGVIARSSVSPELITTAQEQQELIHLMNNAQNESSLTGANKGFVTTAQLSLTSEQSQLLSYLSNNHRKVTAKQLNLRLDKNLDAQLTAAAGQNNYNAVFADAVQQKLTVYQQTMAAALLQTKGVHGRTLLQNDIQAAELLQLKLGNR